MLWKRRFASRQVTDRRRFALAGETDRQSPYFRAPAMLPRQHPAIDLETEPFRIMLADDLVELPLQQRLVLPAKRFLYVSFVQQGRERIL